MQLLYPLNTTRFINFRGETIPLSYGQDGLWRDEHGGVYGFMESGACTDEVVRLGVYPFALPAHWDINKLAKAHDYMYSCPAYQMFHTRKEADRALRKMLKHHGGRFWSLLRWPIYLITRVFGGRYWENERTRWD